MQRFFGLQNLVTESPLRAILIVFDSLNRHMLSPYGAQWTHTPNFSKLAQRCITFDNCYSGSLPTIPARRELHSGRYNFLHRSWGPLEPYDDSLPQILRTREIYTHLVSDNPHYWEEAAAGTYHARYNTWEFFRGQQGDPWKGRVADPDVPMDSLNSRKDAHRQHWINRRYLEEEDQHPQVRTFSAGLDFIKGNAKSDNWFLQIESFDPHEPFFSSEKYQSLYSHHYSGPHFDWPPRKRVTETEDQVEHVRLEYAALLSMCDASLGKVIELMDELQMWDDTLLIVCTDHGVMLGEKNWWLKTIQPWYNELVHLPFFLWDPRINKSGERRNSLIQMIDIAPTILDFFNIPIPHSMFGRPLGEAARLDSSPHEAVLFGMYGSYVNVTDGKYVYMRSPANRYNSPLYEYVCIPVTFSGPISADVLMHSKKAGEFSFTKGVPLLQIPSLFGKARSFFGTILYDLSADPQQNSPIIDDSVELRMASLLVDLMRQYDAPSDQYERLGLPVTGPVYERHLLAHTHHGMALSKLEPLPSETEFPINRLSVRSQVQCLLEHADAAHILRRHIPLAVNMLKWARAESLRQLSVIELAANPVVDISAAQIRAIDNDFEVAYGQRLS